MKMRTQAEVMTYIREQDPETRLTPWALRTMVLSGRVPSVQVGRKRLIDLDTIGDYLLSTPQTTTITEQDSKIRPISAEQPYILIGGAKIPKEVSEETKAWYQELREFSAR